MLIAAESATSTSLPALEQYGILGIFAILLMGVVRYLQSKRDSESALAQAALQKAHEDQIDTLRRAHERESAIYRDQITALTEDKRTLARANDEVTSYMRDKMVPAVADSTRIAADYLAELRRRSP